MKSRILLGVAGMALVVLLSGCNQALIAAGVVPPLDQYENDDNRLTASSIEVFDVQERTISPFTDDDWISFEAVSGESYVIETFAPLDADFLPADTTMTLYNSSFTLLEQDDDGGGEGFSLIEFTANSTDTYYIRVQGFLRASPGPYDISLFKN